MKNINNNVFLVKIYQQINDGNYDEFFTLPFMSKELFFNIIKLKIIKKIETGATPILNDNEIKECITETKEVAASIISLYLKLDFIKKTSRGIEFTKKGYLAIKTAYKNF